MGEAHVGQDDQHQRVVDGSINYSLLLPEKVIFSLEDYEYNYIEFNISCVTSHLFLFVWKFPEVNEAKKRDQLHEWGQSQDSHKEKVNFGLSKWNRKIFL